MDLEALRYPVGKYHYPEKVDGQLKNEWINDIITFPENLAAVVTGLSKEQLEWVYRPEGWTIRQVVHHCADSHLNAIIRFKLALTEDNPTIKPYLEHLWANLADYHNDIEDSVQLLTALHKKWGTIITNLTDSELARTYIHPEHGKTFNLKFTIGMYAWHCRHHYAHILQAIEHKGTFN